MKRRIKVAISFLLCLALVFQLGGGALAAQIAGTIAKGSTVTADGDDVYYYAALGDSVAAGFSITDSIEPGKANTSMYVTQNAKNSPVDCYPALLAGRGYEAYVTEQNEKIAEYNEQLKAKKEADPTNTDEYKSLISYPKYFNKNRLTIQDVIAEQRLIEDRETQFDYSNLGISAFMTDDYIRCLLDEEFVNETFQMMFTAYYQADVDRIKAIGKEAFKAEILGKIKTEFLSAADSWDVVSEKYTAYTYDSESGSYVLSPVDGRSYLISAYSGLDWMTYQTAYAPVPITADWSGQYNLTKEQFVDWINGNDCITYSVFDWTTYQMKDYTLSFAEWCEGYYSYYYDLITGKAYQFHDILMEELKKADLITVNIGANDLLEKLMLYMGTEEFLGFDINKLYQSQEVMALMNGGMSLDVQALISSDLNLAEMFDIPNPVKFAMYMTFSCYAGQGMEIEQAISVGAAILYLCRHSITTDDLVEALQFFVGGGMSRLTMENAEYAMSQYSVLVDMIHSGGTFSYEDEDGVTHTETIEAINPDAQLVFVGSYNPYGNSEIYNGESYDAKSVMSRLTSKLMGAIFNQTMTAGNTIQDIENMNPETLISFSDTMMSSFHVDASGMMDEVIQELRYPLVYNLFGLSGEEACRYVNAYVQELTENQYAALNIPFVDVYDKVSNEVNGDPHPLARGHYEIYDEIIKTLVSDVHTASNEKDGYEIGKNVLWNTPLVGKLTDNQKQMVYANGKPVAIHGEGENKTFTIQNVMEDQYIYVCTGNNVPKYTIQFTDGIHTDVYYAFQNFPLPLPELPLEFTVPDGLTFGGWSIDGVVYQAGELYDKFTQNSEVHAVWLDKNGKIVQPYVLTVEGSHAQNEMSGNYYAGQTITLEAGSPTDGYAFDCWVSEDVTIQNATSATVSFVMPSKNVQVTATWKEVAPKRTRGFQNFVKSHNYSGYSDVNEDYWYGANQTAYIKDATLLGIINGDGAPKYTFRPEENITICEVIKIAAVIHSIYSADDHEFSGTSGVYWYVPYINYAIQEGIIQDTDFVNYEAVATREQVAYIFGNALPEETYENISSLVPSDIAADNPYREPILKLYSSGICNGYENGTFGGKKPIIRAEIAAMIVRIAIPATRIAQ